MYVAVHAQVGNNTHTHTYLYTCSPSGLRRLRSFEAGAQEHAKPPKKVRKLEQSTAQEHAKP